MAKVGIVSFFDTCKGYGVIRVKDSNEVFFVQLYNLINPIKENDLVEFEVEKIKEKLNAVRVRRF